MTRFLTSTALTLMLAGPAFADAHMSKFLTEIDTQEVLGSEFIGARVYVSETNFAEDFKYTENAEREWDDIGEINELVMTRDGEIKAAVIGVGGLMGIGEKSVAVDMNKIEFIQNGDGPSDYFLVFTSSLEELEAAPEWQDAERQMAAAEMREQREERRAEAEKMAEERETQVAETTYDNDAGPEMTDLDGVKRDGYAMVAVDKIDANDLIGARVYGLKDEDVGEVSELVVAKGDGGNKVVIDVGGFLGLGEKSVAVPMSDLRIMKEEGGDDLNVYIDATQERLEKLPEYEM